MLLLYRGENFDANFFYQSGVDIDHSFFLVNGDKKILFTPKMNESIAHSAFDGSVVAYTDPFAELSKYVKSKVVNVDGAISARLWMRLSKLCKLKDYSAELLTIRAKKKPTEVTDVKKAVYYTKQIFASLDFNAAKTELDLKKQLLSRTLDLGLEPAFEPIVSTDKTTSYPHYQPGKKKLGSLILIDYGVRYNHYCSDLTRCFIKDGTRKKKEEYARLKQLCNSIVDELPNLETGKEVAAFSDKLIKKAGFPVLVHSIGHGVGLDIHESPRLGLKSADKIAGSILAIEPAFYYSNYGMRYEETIWFNGKKGKIL